MVKPQSFLLPDRPILMLVDGHSIVYRAYYALAPRMQLNMRSTGEPTGAVFGFANMFIKAWGDVKPTYWAIAFDRAAPTFRDNMYAEYKAGRVAAPDELRSQFSRVRQVVGALGMPVLERDGFEADDVIGTLSLRAAEQGIDTVILTGDTDMIQLISPHIAIRYQSRVGDTAMYDVAKVRERYSLEPAQFGEFKALKGDPSDNIPGIPGVGEVKATRLLQKFGTIDELYRRIEEVEPAKERALLKEYETLVRGNCKLISIVRDMPLEFDFDKARVDQFDRAQTVELFREMEFSSLVGRLPDAQRDSKGALVDDGAPAPAFKTIQTLDELRTLVGELRAAGRFALDVVSTSQLAMTGSLVGLGVSPSPGKGTYIPLGHQHGPQPARDEALQMLKPLLEDAAVRKIAHSGKFDALVLGEEGIALKGLLADVVLGAYVLGAKTLNVKGQAFERLGVEIPASTDITGTGAKAITMAQAPIDRMPPYSVARAEAALRLWPVIEQDLANEKQEKLFRDLEMPLLPVLARLERYGVAIDRGVLYEMAKEMGDRILAIEKQAYDSVGHIFAINSPQQLGTLLFEELHLPKGKRTKQGYSTDATILESLRSAHPVIDAVLEYRQLTKLKSTYVDALPGMVNPRTGRVHTTLSQTVAATGRLSSSDPNLQNIPVRTEMGKRIREAFVAQPDWTLLSADYSQIELRILAHFSKDPGLIEAFQRNEDIHSATAAQVYGVPISEVTPDQRRFAKVVNFGLVYGMGEFGLATRADKTREEAAPIIQQYFEKYPGILQYLEDTKKLAREKGYVETLMGRRRYLPEVHANNFQVRSAAERMAVNMPIQGTAADIIKLAMINLDHSMTEAKMRSRMILQVHDELIFEAPPEELPALKTLVLELMSHAVEVAVPLKVDLKQGRTWGVME